MISPESIVYLGSVLHNNRIMARTKKTPPADKVQLYDRLIASHQDIERKGKTMPYTSHNGHMFTFLSNEGLMGLRLSQEDRESFINEFDTKLMEQYGRIMKEFVLVPEDLLADPMILKPYLQKAYNYVASLKPRSTRSRKK